eukprot:1138593-Pelagomonas_calceolata.AAC.3
MLSRGRPGVGAPCAVHPGADCTPRASALLSAAGLWGCRHVLLDRHHGLCSSGGDAARQTGTASGSPEDPIP